MPIPTLGQWYKWLAMITGNSVQHAPQGKGRAYSKDQLRGYYNDLTNKYLGSAGAQGLDDRGIPVHWLSSGQQVYLPTAVAQYGLGAYDVYLLNGDPPAYAAFLRCAEWLVEDQDQAGGWRVWTRLGLTDGCPYSAMTQGEGASLLYRAGFETGDARFREAAERAVTLMLRTGKDGGTASWEGKRLVLEERPQVPPSAILNGWIFAIFGLYDGILVSHYPKWEIALQKTIDTLEADLRHYDTGYWSFYDQYGNLASPFYHDLHINLLTVLADITGKTAFLKTAERWQQYKNNKLYFCRAFMTKAYQKLKDPGEVVIVK